MSSDVIPLLAAARQRLEYQGGLADAGFTAEEGHRARDESAPQDPVQLPDPGRHRHGGGRADRSEWQRGGAGTVRERPRRPRVRLGRAGRKSGAPPPRRRCSTPRRPGSVLTSEVSYARIRGSGRSSWVASCRETTSRVSHSGDATGPPGLDRRRRSGVGAGSCELDRRRLEALDGPEDDALVLHVDDDRLADPELLPEDLLRKGSSMSCWIARRSGRAPSVGLVALLRPRTPWPRA